MTLSNVSMPDSLDMPLQSETIRQTLASFPDILGSFIHDTRGSGVKRIPLSYKLG